VHTDSVIQIN